MYTKKSLLQKVLCFAAAVFFVLAFVCMGIASARADEQQAFAGEDYSANWELAAANSGIEVKEYSRVSIGANNTPNTFKVLRYSPVTLSEGQSVEITFTVNNALGKNVMTSFNAADTYTEEAESPWGGVVVHVRDSFQPRTEFSTEKVSLITMGQWGLTTISAPETTSAVFSALNKKPVANPWDAWQDANTSFISGVAGDFFNARSITFRAVYNADGSAALYAQLAGDEDWSVIYLVQEGVGRRSDGAAIAPDSSDKVGDSVAFSDKTNTECYPVIAIRAGDWEPNVDHDIYDINVSIIGADEQVINEDDSLASWEAIADATYIAMDDSSNGVPALTVDNALDGDVLVSKQPLAVSGSAVNKAFTISMDVSAQDITYTADYGDKVSGKAVIYLSSSKTDFANAAQIYFDIDGMGVINDDEVIPEYPMTFGSGEFKTLRIESSKSGVNNVYIDDQLAATFNLDLNGKYIAFGTEISTLNSAVLRVKNFSLTEHKAAETDGAAIRIVEGEAGSMRFISSFSKEEIASLGAESYKIGTVIKGGVYTGDELTVETAGALKIENGAGYWKETTEEYVVSAYIYGIDQAHYATEVSARAYIEYVKDGETHYIYGDVISRSLSEVAGSALNDVSDVQDEVYQYDLGNGTFSPYDEATRAILQTYISEV